MTSLLRKVDIQAEPRAVWSALTDFERMPEWFFGVARVELQSREPGPGVERLLTLVYGKSHRERIVQWEPRKLFSIVVLDPPFFVSHWTASIGIEAAYRGVTTLLWEMCWEPRFGRLGRLFDRMALRPVIDLALRISLERLRARLERP